MLDEYDAFSNDHMNLHCPAAWDETAAASLLMVFWSCVKAGLRHGIEKVFITGVAPLYLAGINSGFNVSMNVSFLEKFSGVCGLTQADIRAALEVVCKDKEMAEEQAQIKVEKCLAELTKYAKGFQFCNYREVEPMFNTNTCLGYLEVSH